MFVPSVCLVVAVGLVHAQQARKDACAKVNTLVIKDSVLKPPDMFSMADAVVKDIINNMKLADIPFKNHSIKEIPKNKLAPFNKFKNDLDNCLKKKDRKEKADEIFDQFGKIILSAKIGQSIYDKITKKRDNARKNNKKDDELRPVIYNTAKEELTKAMVQKVLDEGMKQFPCPVWQCIVPSSKPVIQTDKYTVQTKNCKA